MKKEKSLKKIQGKPNKKVWMILLLLLAASFLIVGCVLTGVYYKNFYVYERLVGSWAGGPGFSDYLASHNSNYESYKGATGNTWVYASYSLFALGVSFILISLLIFGGTFYLKKRSAKLALNNHDSEVNQNGNNQKVKKIKVKKPVRQIAK